MKMAVRARTGGWTFVLLVVTTAHHGGADVAVAPLPATYFEHATATDVKEDVATLSSAGPHEGLLHVCHLALALAPAPNLAGLNLAARRSPHHATVVKLLRDMIERGSSRPEVCSQLIHQRVELLAASTQLPSRDGSNRSAQADAEATLIVAEVAAISPPPSNMACTWAVNETRPLACQAKMRDFLESETTTASAPRPSTQPQEAIMLGDSTMARLHLGGNFGHGRKGCRIRGQVWDVCGVLVALGRNASRVEWVPPRPGIEGPNLVGVPSDTKPWCSECTNCRPWIVECCPAPVGVPAPPVDLQGRSLSYKLAGCCHCRSSTSSGVCYALGARHSQHGCPPPPPSLSLSLLSNDNWPADTLVQDSRGRTSGSSLHEMSATPPRGLRPRKRPSLLTLQTTRRSSAS